MSSCKINISKRVQPKSIIHRHHQHHHNRHLLLLHRVRHHPRRKVLCNMPTTKNTGIFPLSNSIHKCRLIKFFSKLSLKRQHDILVQADVGRPAGLKLLLHKDTPTFNSQLPVDLNVDQQLHRQRQRQRQRHRHRHRHQLLPPLCSDKGRMTRTIVLDLDETLVHSTLNKPPETYHFMIKPTVDGVTMNFYVLKRPGVDEFLEAISKRYEVVVFTAGLEEYASLVLDGLDPKGLISHRLYRDSCRHIEGRYVKDLSMLGRDLRKVAIVDDNPKSYSLQPENAVPIKRFEDDVEDRELEKLLLGFFHGFCDGVDDMRDAIHLFLGGAAP